MSVVEGQFRSVVEGQFRTACGVRCAQHLTHALPDEPCWACERAANDPPRTLVDQSRLHLANMKLIISGAPCSSTGSSRERSRPT